jgi:hypothetical protein
VIRICIVAYTPSVNNKSVVPLVPNALPIRQVLDDCAPLQHLQRQLAMARACLDAVTPQLPLPLRSQVRAGPLDTADNAWILLASNAAVAAKLRQLLPRLETALAASGVTRAAEPTAIKVRVQSVG